MLAILPIPTHFYVAWSVICHIRAPCLNRWTDLDAIWQVHLYQWHVVLDGRWPSGDGETWGSNPQPAKTCNCELWPNRRSCAATWRMETRSWVNLPRRFCLFARFGPCLNTDCHVTSDALLVLVAYQVLCIGSKASWRPQSLTCSWAQRLGLVAWCTLYKTGTN